MSKTQNLILILLGITVFISGCRSHAMECVSVEGKDVCFVRNVWGLNGDNLTATMDRNICHEPSRDFDYTSTMLGGGEFPYYKVEDGQLHFCCAGMAEPKNKFPVALVEDKFPRVDEEIMKGNGYTRLDLDFQKMTWCFSDF